jgi:RNA polymerase sigma-70 factor (ECF subfamily)
LLAWLIRVLGDFDLAEDALQEAFLAALRRWPAHGIPDDPPAWLAAVARNGAIDRLRRERRRPVKEAEVTRLLDAVQDDDSLDDARLRLIFTCCHPALSIEARVALTLRCVGGLSSAAIARAFLIPEATLAQRLVRAKHKIRAARIPYSVPDSGQLAERLVAVLAVVYLIFNEGYLSSHGPSATRNDLADRAIALGRVLATLMPAEPEVRSLLALMLLSDSRRGARVDANDELVLLADQDRASWDAAQIQDGIAQLDEAARHLQPGPYFLQAAIAAEHALAADAPATDWRRIARLYELLLRLTPSPVIELNRLVAASFAHGPGAVVSELEALEAQLDDYSYFHAAKASVFERLERPAEAIAAYRRALEVATNPAQRASLERSLHELEEAS